VSEVSRVLYCMSVAFAVAALSAGGIHTPILAGFCMGVLTFALLRLTREGSR
jgi:hypothetical protein